MPAAVLDEHRREIEGARLRACAGCGEGDDTGAAADIEHRQPRADARMPYQLGCGRGGEGFKWGEQRSTFTHCPDAALLQSPNVLNPAPNVCLQLQ